MFPFPVKQKAENTRGDANATAYHNHYEYQKPRFCVNVFMVAAAREEVVVVVKLVRVEGAPIHSLGN